MDQTPYEQLHWLVEQFEQGKVDRDGYLRGLQAVETYFHGQAERMAAVPAPDPVLAGIKERSEAAFDLFLQACEHLRGHADEAEEAGVGLDLARQGQEELGALVTANQERTRETERELVTLRANWIPDPEQLDARA